MLNELIFIIITITTITNFNHVLLKQYNINKFEIDSQKSISTIYKLISITNL